MGLLVKKMLKILNLLLFMKIKLRRKYDIALNFYNKKKINELIFNDPSLYTARFKATNDLTKGSCFMLYSKSV